MQEHSVSRTFVHRPLSNICLTIKMFYLPSLLILWQTVESSYLFQFLRADASPYSWTVILNGLHLQALSLSIVSTWFDHPSSAQYWVSQKIWIISNYWDRSCMRQSVCWRGRRISTAYFYLEVTIYGISREKKSFKTDRVRKMFIFL